MIIREPIVAGQFYPSDSNACRTELVALLRSAQPSFAPTTSVSGGIVPHAGWSFSGSVTALVFRALAVERSPDIVVLFGGTHHYRGRQSAMFTSGQWETPLGRVEIDDRFAERLLGQTNLIAPDNFAHEDEHSIEVQVPFVKQVFPRARLIPIMVPASPAAGEVGEAVARTAMSYGYDALMIGTTDLTHYGPNYSFTPSGIGAEANAWAKDVNDRRFIEAVCRMGINDVLMEAAEHHNACSSGAVAATMAAARELGAKRGVLLAHTSSSEVMQSRKMTDIDNSVGYAWIVFKE